MYFIYAAIALAILGLAAAFEIRRERAAWRRFRQAVERLESTTAKTCPS